MLRTLRLSRLSGIAALLALLGVLAVPSATDASETLSHRSLVAAKAAARQDAYDRAERALATVPPALPGGGPLVTYDARTWSLKDPVNVVFVGATPWDVNYDLEHWARSSWVDARGSRQLVNAGGSWIADSYQLKPSGAPDFPSPRLHVRLFADGALTLADAHHDMPQHRCANGWDASSQQLVDSFRDASGKPLWFVKGIYQVSGFGPPAGQLQCGYYDGLTTVVVLGDGSGRGLPSSASAIQALLAMSAPATTSVT